MYFGCYYEILFLKAAHLDLMKKSTYSDPVYFRYSIPATSFLHCTLR